MTVQWQPRQSSQQGGNNFAEPRAAGPTTRTNAKNSQDISAKTGEHTSEPLLQPFYPDTQDDQGHDNLEEVVYLLTATKIPAGHRKMVHTKICGKPDSTLPLFTPTYSHDSLSLADAAIEGGNELCAMLMVENSGTTSRYLRAGTELGTVSPAEEVREVVRPTGSLVSQLTSEAKPDRRAKLL